MSDKYLYELDQLETKEAKYNAHVQTVQYLIDRHDYKENAARVLASEYSKHLYYDEDGNIIPGSQWLNYKIKEQ